MTPLFSRPWVLNSLTRGFCTESPPSLKFDPIEPIDTIPELSPLYLREPTLELDLKFAGGVWTPPFALYSCFVRLMLAVSWAYGFPPAPPVGGRCRLEELLPATTLPCFALLVLIVGFPPSCPAATSPCFSSDPWRERCFSLTT